MSEVKKRRRRHGERREDVLDGAVQVLIEHGLEGLTHRRVAEAANVPLNATTHYFATRDELLEAAFVRVVTGVRDGFRTWFEALPEDADLIAELAQHFVDLIEERDAAVLLIELWVGALRRENLRQLALGWDEAWAEVLHPRMDPVGARVMARMFGGLAQPALIADSLPSVVEVEQYLRRAYTGP